MKKTGKRGFTAIILTILISSSLQAQLVDAVTAIVGDETIFLSEIESMVLTQRSMGVRTPIARLRCELLEDLMVQKLFLDQARIDSIEVTQDQVDRNLDMRLNDFIIRAGSEENLESYYNKSMIEIRRDLREMMANELLTQQMQIEIASDITTTPADVRKFFSRIPQDSLPLMPAEVEISIVQSDPPNMEENKLEVRQKLLDMRRRIMEGESFKALAYLYSEDEGTRQNNGETGFMPRGRLDKAYADEAFSLKKNTVSRVVESEYGFHIIELIDRNGDMINTRHILLRPKVKPEEAIMAKARLDSIADYIRQDSLSFELAAWRFSSHSDSRMNGGKYVDPETRSEVVAIDQLPPDTYRVVRDLKVGEISDAFETTDADMRTVFRIVRLDRQSAPHKANLKDDFNYIQELAMNNKRAEKYQEWVKEKMEITYIKIADEFKTCNFVQKGWLK
ncbi:MAG: peptidylprolyl isomerase [Marinilabiliaceae bacterium]|jgi:peptidyl-prolyl cis-trans isomerase SurA|nr:peptidylprolyl isomerase [Marinilabiliaceae bacterium]